MALGSWVQIIDILIGSPNSAAAVATGSISGGVMTISSTVGALAVGQVITGDGVTPGTTILSFGTGSGGAGTYNVSITQTVPSETLRAIVPSLYDVLMQINQVPTIAPGQITVTLA
jgi:hypothetical protein